MFFKNIRIGAKMILVSTLILVVALAAVTVIAARQSAAGLKRLGNEQMAMRAKEIAKTIAQSYVEEYKIANALAANPDVVATALSIETNGCAKSGDAIRRASAAFAPYANAAELSSSYETVFTTDMQGKKFADSDPVALAIDSSSREYIKNALAGTANIGDVVTSSNTGNPLSPVAVPVKHNGRVVGACVMILKIQFINDIISTEKIGKTGYAFVIDNKGVVIAHPDAENILTLNALETSGLKEFAQKMVSWESGAGKYVYNGVRKTAAYAPVSITGWRTCMQLSDSDDTFLSVSKQLETLHIAIAVAAIVVVFPFNYLFSRTITKPLSRGVKFAQAVAAGDFSQELDIKQEDEIGMIADALNTMSSNLSTTVATIQESAEQVAASSEEISASAQSLAEGSQSQASTLEQTSASVEELTSSVDQVSGHAQSQAAAVEEGTASMTQVPKSIDDISVSLKQISVFASESVNNAVDGATAVTQVVEGIGQIAISSDKIAGIITVISDIADQTNLLALNASQKVKDMIVTLSESMEQQVGAVKELSKSLENVNELTQIAAAAEEMSGSTGHLSELAQQLQRLTAQFKINGNGKVASGPTEAVVARRAPALALAGRNEPPSGAVM